MTKNKKGLKQLTLVAAMFLVVMFGFCKFCLADNADQNSTAGTLPSFNFSSNNKETPGSSFTVLVNINPNGNLVCKTNFNITYPSNLLELKAAPILGPAFSVTETADSGTSGTIQYSVADPNCTTSNSVVLSIPFTAKAKGSAVLTLSNYGATGGNDQKIATDSSSIFATITIADAAPTSSGSTISNINTVISSAETNLQSFFTTLPESMKKYDKNNNSIFLGGIGLVIVLIIFLIWLLARRLKSKPETISVGLETKPSEKISNILPDKDLLSEKNPTPKENPEQKLSQNVAEVKDNFVDDAIEVTSPAGYKLEPAIPEEMLYKTNPADKNQNKIPPSSNLNTEAQFVSDEKNLSKNYNSDLPEKETQNVEIAKASDSNYNDLGEAPLIIPDLNKENVAPTKSDLPIKNDSFDNQEKAQPAGDTDKLSW